MSLKISRILHAGYIFETESTQIGFDTIFENPFSVNCFSYPSVLFDEKKIQKLKLNALFISHYHDDHCSMQSLRLLDRNTPIYMYCLYEEMFFLIKNLGFTHVYPLQLNKPISIGDITVTPYRALDVDVDCIFQINSKNVNVLNVVDSWIDDETIELLRQRGPWDMLLWPFQTMQEIQVLAPTRSLASDGCLPIEWLEQIKKINPKCIVPSSCQFIFEEWSWYNNFFFPISYKKFEEEIIKILPMTKVVRINPGVSFKIKNCLIEQEEPLAWIQAVGEQDVEYKYEEKIKPPSTAEIAKRFNKLAPVDRQKVIDYCNNELVAKFISLEPPMDPYFAKPVFWQLSVYDHLGQATKFYYEICGNQIKKIDKIPYVSWLTEVSEAKLLAAIENGESLTSMYIRINDIVFESRIEEEINEADIMEDPLIRCLYNGEFASYQKAQLNQIKRM